MSNRFKVNIGKTTKQNCYFTAIVNQVSAGKSPYDAKFIKKLRTTKRRVSYYLSILKQFGILYRIGYGVWEINHKRLQKSTRIGKARHGKKLRKVRGHGFQARLKIPILSKWGKRGEYLKRKGIQFKVVNVGYGSYQSLEVEGWRTWLCSKSIVLFAPSGYSIFDETAPSVYEQLLNVLFLKFKKLESLLGVSLQINKKYKFKVSRSHYGLVRNVLARFYSKRGMSLSVFDERGQWLVIDDSFSLQELETVHPVTSMSDNVAVQNWFNKFKKYPITNEDLVNFMAHQHGVNENFQHQQESFARNLDLHLEVLEDLRDVVKKIKGDKSG